MALFGRPTAEDDRKAQQWAEWFAKRNPLAIASLVLGVFSLIEFGALIIFGIAGVALGIVALMQLARATDRPDAKRDLARGDTPPAASGPRPSLGYSDATLPEPIPSARYDRIDVPVPRTKGHALAWSGILLSVASLVIATVLYLPLVR
jgi:hypothetical protein